MENGNVGASVVVLLVKYYKQKMVALLKRNGVNVPDRASDNDIIMLVTATLKSSNAFRKDVKKFVSNPRVLASLFSQFKNFTDDSKFFGFTEEAEYFRFTEEADYFRMDGYNNVTGIKPTLDLTSTMNQFGLDFTTPTTPSTTSTEQPKQTSSFWSKAFDFVNKGIDTFVTLDTNKTNRAIANSQTKVDEGEKTLELPKDDTKSNTTTYVILGIVGVALLGAVIYFASKKRS
jgi:hypothetical protein